MKLRAQLKRSSGDCTGHVLLILGDFKVAELRALFSLKLRRSHLLRSKSFLEYGGGSVIESLYDLSGSRFVKVVLARFTVLCH